MEFLGEYSEWKPDGYLDFWVFDKFNDLIKISPYADSNTAKHQPTGIVTQVYLTDIKKYHQLRKSFQESYYKTLVIQIL